MGRGRRSWRSFVWIVFDQRITIANPHGKAKKSLLERWREGLNLATEGGRTLDLRSRPKNSVRHIAQNTLSVAEERSSWERIPRRRSGVIGNLRFTSDPFTLAIPFRIHEREKLSDRGLGKPHST